MREKEKREGKMRRREEVESQIGEMEEGETKREREDRQTDKICKRVTGENLSSIDFDNTSIPLYRR